MSLPTPCLKPKADNRDLRKDVPITAHKMSFAELLKEYEVDPEKGLTSAQVEASRAKHGYNRLTPPVIMPEWLRFLLQFWNIFALLLLAGGILCWVAYALDTSDPSNMYLGIVLIAVVAITSVFGYFQEAKAAKVMDGFRALVPKKCKVLRDGNMQVLDASELVPGDVVHFQEGDQVPADLRVITATSLKVDNSSLTGESEAQDRLPELQADEGGHGDRGVPAIEAQNLMFFSTIITNGFGSGIVVGTGDNTVMGQIAGLASETEGKETLIAKDIHRFILIISVIAITLGITFLVVGITQETHSVVQALVLAISVIVATVPEGLLVTLTVSLALTAKRMHSKNVLVKNTESVETLGSTTLIASDKTGTLTQNRMTVQHCWVDGQLYTMPAFRNAVELKQQWGQGGTTAMPHYDKDSASFKALQLVATLCNNSEFIVNDPDDPSKPALDLAACAQDEKFNLLDLNCTGDASESGLIKAMQLLRDVKEYRLMYPKLFEIKFNSTNKWQLSIHKNLEDPTAKVPLLVLKGAPERVVKLCTHVMMNGQRVPFSPDIEAKFLQGYEGMGSLGERVLGFAMRTLDEYPLDYEFTDQPEPNFPRDGLTFVGLFSLMDPPRIGVKEAVSKCKTASVKVFMVTGDHPITAQAIATQIGIIDEDVLAAGRARVVTGDDIRDIVETEDSTKQEAMWDHILLDNDQLVFARVTPAHKLQIVEANQKRGQIVSVTGDGVNDAPALKMANVGVAMGIAGKDVTKEAADIILMDDNFASIVAGVEEGRLIFDNLKKSIMYTLTSKIPELMPFIIYVAGQFPPAITTILILCVDLGTDMVPAISLAYETREADIMDRPPRDAQKDHLVDWRLLNFSYLHLGVLQAVAGYFAFVAVLNDFGYNPDILMRTGISWSYSPLLCTSSEGKVIECGYGCGTPVDSTYNSRNAAGTPYCASGCPVPTADVWDPFSEFTPSGFRGFAGGADAVCGRSCSWYQGLTPETKESLIATGSLLTPQDITLFDFYCSSDGPDYGFPGRGRADKYLEGPEGSVYWWGAAPQAYPNVAYQNNVLRTAQTAYFIAVVLGKMMTVVVSKTRLLSVFQHGILNNTWLLGAIVFEICVMVLLVYVPPFNSVFGTLFLYGQHWCLGIPWAIFLFFYDEIRKFLMRRDPRGVVRRTTYW